MKDRQRIWPALVSLWKIVCFVGFSVNVVNADIGEQKLPDALLQYRAGNHILGFGADKVYLVNMAGALRIEFLNPQIVSPLTLNEAGAPSHETQSSLPTNKKTLENLSRIEYRDLWKGITLRYDAVEQGISESTYIVEPGAEVADISWRYNTDAEVQQDGSLKITLATRKGYITESRPVAWQIINGKKVAVDVAFTLKEGIAGFSTGRYNREHELIIDPTYSWHTFYGSAANADSSEGIAIDGSGNIYVTGESSASWLGPDNTAPKHSYSGSSDIFILKLNSSGVYQWHTFFGSATVDASGGIAVDKSGNIYVTGESYASWLGPNTKAPKNDYSGNTDITILKLNSSGIYQWHTFFGSADHDRGSGIAIDSSDNIYITGYSRAGWSVTNSMHIIRQPKNLHSGGNDIAVIRLDSSGTSLWHTFYGSSMNDEGRGVVALENGNIYIVGTSDATWQGPGTSNPKYPYSGGSDIVGVKLDNTGVYIGHTFHGSTNQDVGMAVAVDSSGNIYITGNSTASWGTPVLPHNGSKYDMVVVKLDSSGTYKWNTFLGSSDTDEAKGISVNRDGKIFVTGYSYAAWGSPVYSHSGEDDITIVELNSEGQLLWHAFFGSSFSDSANGINISGNGDIYTTGPSRITWGSPLNPPQGNSDFVVLKLKTFYWPMFFPAIIQ